MRGSLHVLSSLFVGGCVLFLLVQLHALTFLQATLVLAGIAVGCMLPDADARDARIFHTRLRPLAFFTRWAMLFPASVLLRLVGIKHAHGHRRLLHSLLGAACCITGWTMVAVVLFPFQREIISFLVAGLCIGWMLHLYEDMLTRSGIPFFFPLSGRIAGKMVTGASPIAFWESDATPAFLLCAASAFLSLAVAMEMIPVQAALFFLALSLAATALVCRVRWLKE